MLRAKLSEVCTECDLSKQQIILSELRLSHNHCISVIESDHDLDGYTCVVHTFNFVGDELYVSIASHGSGRIFAGAKFVDFLLLNDHLQQINENSAKPGDIILYFSGNKFRHAGLFVSNGRAESKWGTGLLLEHSLTEVPEQYGDDIRFYERIDKPVSLNLFVDFSNSMGLRFK